MMHPFVTAIPLLCFIIALAEASSSRITSLEEPPSYKAYGPVKPMDPLPVSSALVQQRPTQFGAFGLASHHKSSLILPANQLAQTISAAQLFPAQNFDSAQVQAKASNGVESGPVSVDSSASPGDVESGANQDSYAASIPLDQSSVNEGWPIAPLGPQLVELEQLNQQSNFVALDGHTNHQGSSTTEQSNHIREPSTFVEYSSQAGEQNSSSLHHLNEVHWTPNANSKTSNQDENSKSSDLGAQLGQSGDSNLAEPVRPSSTGHSGSTSASGSSSGYFFSSSERLPTVNKDKAPNAWWALGFGEQFDKASNLTRNDYLDFCAKSELLVTNKQRSLCRMHPKTMAIVARGLKLAIDECQTRFSSSRWNCSLAINEHSTFSSGKSNIFGDIMRHPNRERSFLNAIVAAGLAHAMTKACSQNELPGECSCDKKIKASQLSRNKPIEWVACSDDIDYGAKFSRDFTDQPDYSQYLQPNEASGPDNSNQQSTSLDPYNDRSALINAHNYEVGRRVFKSATDITCTCRDSTELGGGSCATKRCWRHLSPFTDIGEELLRRYDSATHVQPSNRDPQKLRPVKRGVRKPRRKDLVFIDESPDYCTQDNRLGILGTQNRHCNSTSSGTDSCPILCCGRGYQTVVDEVEEDCNCKFVWCCELKCSRCKRQIISDVCN